MRKTRNLKTCLVLVAICLLPGEVVWAQGWQMNDAPADSVYDASTQAAEKPEIKTLSLDQFSAYGADISKKYQFEGPLEVKGPEEVAELKKKLTEARKKLFTRLCDPEVRKDETLKSELQSQMKSLTEDIRTFPKLEGFEPGVRTGLADPIKDVRDQINQKHGKYYVTPMPKK
ncbi:MAG: hypothetical protein SFY67_17195 [Candidatus Melainabacteria bacterium]|nr:hypothetical protein [Candidatus Melainabacteria bacterium]